MAKLIGCCRTEIPIYGSGGFTTYSDRELEAQHGDWVFIDGCSFVKMKVGTHPDDDPRRVKVAKGAIGRAQLFIDANGAYTVEQALSLSGSFAAQNVTWFEADVNGTRFLFSFVKSLQLCPQHANWRCS